MSAFLTKLEYLPVLTEYDRWMLTGALVYDSDVIGVRIVVPAGYVTDFVSGDDWIIVRRIVNDAMRRAAVLHDFAYEFGFITREQADALFLEAMQVDDVVGWRRWCAWIGVRLAGGSHYRDDD